MSTKKKNKKGVTVSDSFGKCLVTQSSLTLRDPIDCSPPDSFVRGDFPGQNTGVGCHALLQGIFPTQGLNSGLPHCRRILYHLSYQGSPRMLEWVAYLQGNFPGIKPGSLALQANSLPAKLLKEALVLGYSHRKQNYLKMQENDKHRIQDERHRDI